MLEASASNNDGLTAVFRKIPLVICNDLPEKHR